MMTRDDIDRMAREAGCTTPGKVFQFTIEELERFAVFVAPTQREALIKAGWRQCAEGQRTTQFCALLEAAVKAEREACAKVCEEMTPTDVNGVCPVAAAIRARGTSTA